MQIKTETEPGLTRSWDHGEYCIKLYKWIEDDILLSGLKLRVAEINSDVYPDMDPHQAAKEIRHHMSLITAPSTSLLIATSYRGEDLGFYIRREIKVQLGDGHQEKVAFTASREVRRGYQRQGIGTALIIDGHEELTERCSVRYYAGRTQDEIVIASLQKSNLFPYIWAINGKYQNGSDPQRIMWYVATEAIYGKSSPADISTGLVLGPYGGERGGYDLDLSHPRISAIHGQFIDLGLTDDTKKQGYAVIYVATTEKQESPLGLVA